LQLSAALKEALGSLFAALGNPKERASSEAGPPRTSRVCFKKEILARKEAERERQDALARARANDISLSAGCAQLCMYTRIRPWASQPRTFAKKERIRRDREGGHPALPPSLSRLPAGEPGRPAALGGGPFILPKGY